MIDSRVVRRYAAALYGQANAAGVVDQVESDLGLIAYLFESVSSLPDSLFSPVITPENKHEIIDLIFREKVHDLTLSYLHLLIDKRRIELMQNTEPEFVRLANEGRGVTIARVTTAVELTESEIAELKEKLSANTGLHIDLQLEIDPSIIAGVVVQIGDTVIDGSIAEFLVKLKEQLLTKQSK